MARAHVTSAANFIVTPGNVAERLTDEACCDRCEELKWVMGWLPEQRQQLQVKVRHGPVLYDCSIRLEESRSERHGGPNSSGSGWGSGEDHASSGSNHSLHESEQRANIVWWHSQPSSVSSATPNRLSGCNSSQPGCADSGGNVAASVTTQHVRRHAAEPRIDLGPQPSCTAVVRLACQDQGLAPGQLAVFYQRGICVGSGIIAEAL